MNRHELLTISKYAYKEAFLQGQLDQAGSQLSSIMEKMEKNTKYLRNQNIAMKTMMTIYVSLLVICIPYLLILCQNRLFQLLQL